MSRLLPSTVLRPSPYPSPDCKLYGHTRQMVQYTALVVGGRENEDSVQTIPGQR